MQKTLKFSLSSVVTENQNETVGILKHGDTLALGIQVLDADSKVINLTDKTVKLIFKKQDLTVYEKTITDITDLSITTTGYQPVTYTGSLLTVLLDEQGTNANGNIKGEIWITDTAGTIITNTFTLLVIPSLSDSIISKSVDEIQTLAELVTVLKEYLDLSIAIAGTTTPIEALIEIKEYIDTNLSALQSANSQAITNISNENTANDELEITISNATTIKNALDTFATEHADITDLVATVTEHSTQLSDIEQQILESTGSGIISGGEVTSQATPNMTVNVATGTVHMADGKRYKPSANNALAITASNTINSRKDIVYVSSTGLINYLVGTQLSKQGSMTYTVTTNFEVGDSISVEGVLITATTSTTDSTHFAVYADITTTTAKIVAALNANSTITSVYSVTSSGVTFTLTEKTSGGGHTPSGISLSGTGVIEDGIPTTSTGATAPATPTDSLLLAEIYVGAGVTTIVSSNIIDKRKFKNTTDNLASQISENKNNINNVVQQNLIINVCCPPIGSNLTACKIDGTTDDTIALQAIFDFAGSNINYTKIVIPKSNNAMLISATCTLDRSNILLEINSDIILTSTTDTYAFIIGGTAVNKAVKVSGKGIVIDGNGSNMNTLTYVADSTPAYCCMCFKRIDGLKIDGIIFKNGLVECCVVTDCRNIEINNCEFNGSLFDNGLSIYNTLYGTTYKESDASTWTNAVVSNCKANNCVDFGMTAFKAVNVSFENCVSTNCGNYTNSGQYGKGGGYSAENYDITRNAKIRYKNCKAISCVGRGFYVDANDVVFDNLCECRDILSAISNGYTATNDELNGINGIGIRCSDNTDIVVQGYFKNCTSKAIVYQSWNSAMTSKITMKNIDIDGCGDYGIFVSGCKKLILDNIVTASTNNNASYSGSTSSKAIYLSNVILLSVNNVDNRIGSGYSYVGIFSVAITTLFSNNIRGDVTTQTAYNYTTLELPDLGSTWDKKHIKMGSYHLWVDGNGVLRIKASAPTSSTDGTIVGTQA